MTFFTSVMRFFYTVRTLKLRQIIYRLYYRFRRLDVNVCDAAMQRGSLQAWRGASFHSPATLDGKSFEFLGYRATVDTDWNRADLPKLWLYNLHYLDDLNAVDAIDFQNLNKKLVNDWIDHNPPMAGNGWEPYSLSLRIVNLVKWYSCQPKLQSDWLPNLATQARALTRQIEHHILGNHLFANGKALVFVGSFLSGSEADSWLDAGLKILDKEVPEQFLADGAHFELSPMYHAILLWDMCDLLQLAQATNLKPLEQRIMVWRGVVKRGLEWLQDMVHPDEEISFFNDATFGVAPRLKELQVYASSLGCSQNKGKFHPNTRGWVAAHLEQSGYIVLDLPKYKHKAILDVARVGPDYQPGHAHADTLSFELSLFGQRVFVNSGISQYGEDSERQRQRGTAAHNTLEVDGEDSSEVWGGFRVARRAYPKNIALNAQINSLSVKASHTGYERLPGKVTHSRTWHFHSNEIVLEDTLTGTFKGAIARFYCHPAVHILPLSDVELNLLLPDENKLTISFVGARLISVQKATWHSRFGVSQENQCIVVELADNELKTNIGWSYI